MVDRSLVVPLALVSGQYRSCRMNQDVILLLFLKQFEKGWWTGLNSFLSIWQNQTVELSCPGLFSVKRLRSSSGPSRLLYTLLINLPIYFILHIPITHEIKCKSLDLHVALCLYLLEIHFLPLSISLPWPLSWHPSFQFNTLHLFPDPGLRVVTHLFPVLLSPLPIQVGSVFTSPIYEDLFSKNTGKLIHSQTCS